MCSRLLVVGLAGVACASLQTRRDKLVRVDGGLKVTPGKPFDHAWLAGYTRDTPQYAAEELAELLSRLPSPTFVEVFELHGAAAETGTCKDDELRKSGKAAREVVDACLSEGPRPCCSGT